MFVACLLRLLDFTCAAALVALLVPIRHEDEILAVLYDALMECGDFRYACWIAEY